MSPWFDIRNKKYYALIKVIFNNKMILVMTLTIFMAKQVPAFHNQEFSSFGLKYPFSHNLQHDEPSVTAPSEVETLDPSVFEESDDGLESTKNISSFVDKSCSCGVPHNAAYKLSTTTSTDEEKTLLNSDRVVEAVQNGVLGGIVTERDKYPWTVRLHLH